MSRFLPRLFTDELRRLARVAAEPAPR